MTTTGTPCKLCLKKANGAFCRHHSTLGSREGDAIWRGPLSMPEPELKLEPVPELTPRAPDVNRAKRKNGFQRPL
jgi:hypothetical protein